jgi:hypothetical protein
MYWNDTTVYLYSQQTALRDDQRLNHGCYARPYGARGRLGCKAPERA